MWYLKLNDHRLKSILAFFMMEYTMIKSIPITDEEIERLRIHLLAKTNKLIKDRTLYKIATTENDETANIEEIINDFTNSLKVRR